MRIRLAVSKRLARLRTATRALDGRIAFGAVAEPEAGDDNA
jgi:hypothetical protein